VLPEQRDPRASGSGPRRGRHDRPALVRARRNAGRRV